MKTNPAPLGPSAAAGEILPTGQARLLALLQQQSGPATLTELADASGLHPNTLRAHLEGLLARGDVVRTSEPAAGPGRPAHRYAVTGPRPAPAAELTGLAVALAGAVARSSVHPEEDARHAGRAWGHRLAEERPGQAPEPVAALARMGFAPERDTTDAGLVRLTRCPLLDAAREAPDIVCGVHQGLVEGLLEHAGASTEGVELQPFAEIGSCRLLLPHSRP
ncbi:helix-turn-helix transcriptional regulator [Nocardioides sp.]|uniref:helix-turn-helix transcriptional regulator n=1 Tax=Nocardioides sp. TaxID=35761 RepID=UPI002ED4C48A